MGPVQLPEEIHGGSGGRLTGENVAGDRAQGKYVHVLPRGVGAVQPFVDMERSEASSMRSL